MRMCVKGVDVARSSGWWRHRRRDGMGGRWIYDCKLRVTSRFVNGSVFLLCVYVTEDECCLYGYNSWFYLYPACRCRCGCVTWLIYKINERRVALNRNKSTFLDYGLKKISAVGKIWEGCWRNHLHCRKSGKAKCRYPLIDLGMSYRLK